MFEIGYSRQERDCGIKLLFVARGGLHLPFLGSVLCLGQTDTGTPPFQSFGGGPFDVVNLGNLNAHFTVPVFSKAGRGVPFTYNLSYDTSVWYPTTVNSVLTWQPVSTYWGWHRDTQSTTGTLYYSVTQSNCTAPEGGTFIKTRWNYKTYVDPSGTSHAVGLWITDDPCFGSGTGVATKTLTDGSGYSVYADDTPYADVRPKEGGVIHPTFNAGSGSGNETDANGNFISVNSSGVFTDTLGTTALTVTGAPPNPVSLTYTSPAGTQVSVTLNYTTYPVRTNFGCSGVAEYGPLNTSLVSSVTLPDGSTYNLTYEPTPGYPSSVTGRLQSVTLPTGGTITYTYTGGNNGITCADGSTAGLTRATPDGTWTYARSGASPAWVTTVTDPQGSQTVINFQGLYETQRQVYQGSSSGGTLLGTVVTCYNGNLTNCTTTPITAQITRRTVTTQLPGGLQAKTDTYYNTYGLVTRVDSFGYGSGAPGSLAQKTLTTYATLGNGIVDRPSTVEVQDGVGTTKAKTTFSYDQSAATATSGTPQHNSVTGSRGNVTTINFSKTATTYLTKTFTYYDTGTVKTATDVNGAGSLTTYIYGAGSCGNSFVTSLSLPMSLTRSMTWDCTGGVVTSVTDENNATTTTTYTDPYFWRPASATDAALNATNFSYTSLAQSEASLVFNGGQSSVDIVTTRDALGRPQLAQRAQGPGSANFDSVWTGYDANGRPYRRTLPYVAALGQTNPTGPAVTSTYDALDRILQAADSGGGTVTFSYSQNDVLVTLGPAPAGENTKRKQYEYDALGRLTSVCEVTSGAGSGTCGQTVPQTGYWTKYTYDAAGRLTGVTQNAQSASTQTRTYAYDFLGRLTSEANPETGTTSYSYDSATGCTGTYNGDLVKRTDAVGNTTCYTYDSLHRVLSVAYSGPYAASTPTRKYVYDSATINTSPTPTTMLNAKGRLAEAYTCTGTCTTKVTDLGFSYSVRGEVADVYQSSPNSGGYYHLTATYWTHGALASLSGLPGLPTLTSGLDGEGRPTSISVSSGQNPMSSASYNVASQPTQVVFGSTDSDSFNYDTNTGRFTSYTFNVNNQTLVGNLTWNANGSLGAQAITDQVNPPNAQNCTYTHEDLGRVASANCGPVWSQTFSYDAVGNINKSGTSSFQPTYSTSTNRMTQLPGFTPTYDANGNLLNDSLHSYTWDAEGRPVTIDSVNVTYDALGRMAEQSRGGAYSQIVYGPGGNKLAIMSGQTLQKAFVPLLAGAQAVYTSAGLSYYRHPDWLGSSRLSSTSTRTVYYDAAYAPFGESYAETGTTDRSFTGQNQDTVTGLYDFLLREYSPIQGRWASPDPLGLGAVNATHPQTWNRYVYVGNSPLTAVDPLGLFRDVVTPGGGGGCYINGIIASCAVVRAFANAGGGGEVGLVAPGFLNPVAIGNAGFAFASITAIGISWSFSFIPYYNGDPLSNEAAADLLGLPSGPGASGGAGGSSVTPQQQGACIVRAVNGILAGNFVMQGNSWNHGGHANFLLASTIPLSGPALNQNISLLQANSGFAPPGSRFGGVFNSLHIPWWNATPDGTGTYSMTLQAHFDLANPASGLFGMIIHAIVDVGGGNVLRGNRLDRGCK